MPGERPILMTHENADRLRRLMRHRIVAGSGIKVSHSLDATTISAVRTQPRDVVGDAGGLAVRTALISGFGGDGNWYRLAGTLIDDATGQTIGSGFFINVFSYPLVAGRFGFQDLRNCHPNYTNGDLIRVYQGTHWDGGQSITGWWALDSFVQFCEVTP